MTQEIQSMHQLLQRVQDSEEHTRNTLDQMKIQVQAYDAETKRIAALTPTGAFSEEQLHDMIMGTLHAAIASGDILSGVQQSATMSQQPPPGPMLGVQQSATMSQQPPPDPMSGAPPMQPQPGA
jgi:hypothetical protein